MKNAELRRTVKGARRAFLFVHGIIGTPDQFAYLIDVIPENVTLWNIRLDGHGGSVRDFAKTSMKKWEAQFEREIEQLSERHDEIYIVAHSMGTLFAIRQAIKNPKIAGLFFLQVPMTVSLKPRMVGSAVRILLDRVAPDDLETVAAQRCYGIERSLNLFGYIGWLPRYFELFAKIREVKRELALLKTPCVAYQSKRDELVSVRSAKILRRFSSAEVFELEKSGHFYYEENDLAFLRSELQKFARGREEV